MATAEESLYTESALMNKIYLGAEKRRQILATKVANFYKYLFFLVVLNHHLGYRKESKLT